MKIDGVLLSRIEEPTRDPRWCKNQCGRLARWEGRHGLVLCGEPECACEARRLQREADRHYAETADDCRGDWRGIGDPRGYGVA